MTDVDKIHHGILCHGGDYFDFRRPEEFSFSIEDIATSLSNICRFNGHTRKFYSVAEHCVNCSHLVPDEYALEALLHDAAEAFLGDVTRPLKMLLPDYRDIECHVERVIFDHFGLSLPLSEHTRLADLQMLKNEQAQAMLNLDSWPVLSGVSAPYVPLLFLEPRIARQMFLDRFHLLSGGAE